MSITGVVEEIARQVRVQGIPHQRLLAKDERTLRVHQKRRGIVHNTDITLTQRDTYDLAVYELDMRMEVGGQWNPRYAEVVAEAHYADIYWDQLPELVGQAHERR